MGALGLASEQTVPRRLTDSGISTNTEHFLHVEDSGDRHLQLKYQLERETNEMLLLNTKTGKIDEKQPLRVLNKNPESDGMT